MGEGEKGGETERERVRGYKQTNKDREIEMQVNRQAKADRERKTEQ